MYDHTFLNENPACKSLLGACMSLLGPYFSGLFPYCTFIKHQNMYQRTGLPSKTVNPPIHNFSDPPISESCILANTLRRLSGGPLDLGGDLSPPAGFGAEPRKLELCGDGFYYRKIFPLIYFLYTFIRTNFQKLCFYKEIRRTALRK